MTGFLDPVFFVRISDRVKNEKRLFAAGGLNTGYERELERGFAGKYVQSVSVTDTKIGNGSIAVQLEPPREFALGPDGLLNSSILALGNIIEVHWGYPSVGMLRKAYGVLTVPDIDIGEQVSITVNADGFLFGAMRRGKRHVWREDPTDPESPAVSPQLIITELMKNFGFIGDKFIEFKFEDDRFSKVPEQPEVQPSGSDWDFIQGLAKKYNADAFMVGGTKLRVIDRKLIRGASAKAVSTFRMYGQLDSENNIFPLLSFTSAQGGQVLAMNAREMSAADIDADKGPGEALDPSTDEPEIIRANKTDQVGSPQKKVMGGPGTDVEADFKGIAGLKVDAGFTDPKDTGATVFLSARLKTKQQELDSRHTEAALKVLEATATAIGLPGLLPTALIKAEGVGKLYENTYEVETVTHQLGSGYEMEMELVADSHGVEPAVGNDGKKVDHSVEKDAEKVTVAEVGA